MTEEKNTEMYGVRERWRARGAAAAIAFAGGRARLFILFVTALFAVWQGYIFVWVPLRGEAQLPAGLTSVQPTIDVEGLATIQSARAQRLQHTVNRFPEADRYFVVSSSVP